jgi:hypothetical protein
MDRIGGDDVEFGWSGEQIMPRVVIGDVSARVVQHAVVFFTEIFV